MRLAGYFLPSLCLLFSSCFYHKSRTVHRFDNFALYNYTHFGGLLYGNIRTYEFANAEKADTLPVPASRLNRALDRARVKRAFLNGPLGAETRYLFCRVQLDGERHRLLLCNNYFLVDFTARKNYLVKNEDDKLWLDSIGRMVYKNGYRRIRH